MSQPHRNDWMVERAEPIARALVDCLARGDRAGAGQIIARSHRRQELYALVVALAAIAAQTRLEQPA